MLNILVKITLSWRTTPLLQWKILVKERDLIFQMHKISWLPAFFDVSHPFTPAKNVLSLVTQSFPQTPSIERDDERYDSLFPWTTLNPFLLRHFFTISGTTYHSFFQNVIIKLFKLTTLSVSSRFSYLRLLRSQFTLKNRDYFPHTFSASWTRFGPTY